MANEDKSEKETGYGPMPTPAKQAAWDKDSAPKDISKIEGFGPVFESYKGSWK